VPLVLEPRSATTDCPLRVSWNSSAGGEITQAARLPWWSAGWTRRTRVRHLARPSIWSVSGSVRLASVWSPSCQDLGPGEFPLARARLYSHSQSHPAEPQRTRWIPRHAVDPAWDLTLSADYASPFSYGSLTARYRLRPRVAEIAAITSPLLERNYLTLSDGLLTRYKVAREFEFNSLRHRVYRFRDSLLLCTKNAHLAGIRHARSTGEPVSSGSNASFEDFSLLALWAVDLAFDEAVAVCCW